LLSRKTAEDGYIASGLIHHHLYRFPAAVAIDPRGS